MATNNSINDPLPTTVPNGGTGLATATTAYGVVCAGTTATGNFQVLNALGSSGDVLTSNGAGALPSFQAPTGGSSALTLISSVTASSSSTIDFSNKLTSTYDVYFVTCENLIFSAVSAKTQVRVGTGGTPTYQTTNYSGVYSSIRTASGGTSLTTAIDMCNTDSGTTANRTGSFFMYLYNCNNSSNDKVASGILNQFNSSSTDQTNIFGGRWQGATVLTSLRFLPSTGNFSTGTFKLYGISN